jgi:hypothetical protein
MGIKDWFFNRFEFITPDMLVNEPERYRGLNRIRSVRTSGILFSHEIYKGPDRWTDVGHGHVVPIPRETDVYVIGTDAKAQERDRLIVKHTHYTRVSSQKILPGEVIAVKGILVQDYVSEQFYLRTIRTPKQLQHEIVR